jgi:hypothetical protein
MARLAAAAGAAVAALILVAMSLWYLGQSLTLALEAAALTPAQSRLVTGLVGLLLVGLLAVIAKMAVTRHAPAPARAPAASPVADAAAQFGGLVAQQLLSSTRDHPYGAAGAALAAGLAVGAIPELRDMLKRVIKH